MKKFIYFVCIFILIPSIAVAHPSRGKGKHIANEANLSEEQKDLLRKAREQCRDLQRDERHSCMQKQTSQFLSEEQIEILRKNRKKHHKHRKHE